MKAIDYEFKQDFLPDTPLAAFFSLLADLTEYIFARSPTNSSIGLPPELN